MNKRMNKQTASVHMQTWRRQKICWESIHLKLNKILIYSPFLAYRHFSANKKSSHLLKACQNVYDYCVRLVSNRIYVLWCVSICLPASRSSYIGLCTHMYNFSKWLLFRWLRKRTQKHQIESIVFIWNIRNKVVSA